MLGQLTVNVGGKDGVMLAFVAARPDDLNLWAAAVHKLNAKWWHDPATGLPIERRKRQMLQLMLSEVAEAMEGERKNLMDDKLPQRRMGEVEIADTVIRALDWCGGFGIKLEDYVAISGYYFNSHDTPQPFHADNDAGDDLFLISRCIHMMGHIVGGGNQFKKFGRETDYTVVMNKAAASDLIHACECYCHARGYSLWSTVVEKLNYNVVRKDHQAEARLQADGKKW